MVFAADLEEVEEVGCRGVDGDCVLVGGGGGVGEGGDGEFVGALGGGIVLVREMGDGRCDEMRERTGLR